MIANRLAPFEVAGPDVDRGDRDGQLSQLRAAGRRQRRCWGQNDDGQLGNGSQLNSGAPVGVFSLPPSTAIAAGGRHSCARLADGTVQCWGGNDVGELGDGTTTAHSFPEPVTGVTGAIAVAAGFNHSCALRAGGDGDVLGRERLRPAGRRDDDRQRGAGRGRRAGAPAVAIAAGYNHNCAVLASGEARCWGWNAAGQLGDGTKTDSATPVAVASLAHVTTIAGGGFHTCAAGADGAVACWGSNDSGQLGDGTTTNRSTPMPVAGVGL